MKGMEYDLMFFRQVKTLEKFKSSHARSIVFLEKRNVLHTI